MDEIDVLNTILNKKIEKTNHFINKMVYMKH